MNNNKNDQFTIINKYDLKNSTVKLILKFEFMNSPNDTSHSHAVW